MLRHREETETGSNRRVTLRKVTVATSGDWIYSAGKRTAMTLHEIERAA